MARRSGAGAPPKESASEAVQRRRELMWNDLGESPVPGAPTLPNAGTFSAETRAWYATWRKSPQASMFAATDWQTLHRLAYLVDEFFREPNVAKHSEIRNTEAKLGATVQDRQTLRWRIGSRGAGAPPKSPEPDGDVPERPAQVKKGDPRLKLAG